MAPISNRKWCESTPIRSIIVPHLSIDHFQTIINHFGPIQGSFYPLVQCTTRIHPLFSFLLPYFECGMTHNCDLAEVSCLNPCLQGTCVRVVSPQPQDCPTGIDDGVLGCWHILEVGTGAWVPMPPWNLARGNQACDVLNWSVCVCGGVVLGCSNHSPM